MARPVHTPRVNNNDDTVQVVGLNVSPGDKVARGQLLAEVETDKSVSEIESEHDGFILDILCSIDDKITVGSVMMWVGDTPDEPIPESTMADVQPDVSNGGGRPTVKARMLLQKYGLNADQVPISGDRMNVADVESHMHRNGMAAANLESSPVRTVKTVGRGPETAGEFVDMTAEEHGMLATVSWHRDRAAAAYLEVEYDPQFWDQVAADYARKHGLMLSPLMSLMAYRLVELARNKAKLNSTIVDDQRFQYRSINLGFTVQAGSTLYLTVVKEAESLDVGRFIEVLGEVQRHAIAHRLKPQESQGATIGFSSMSRWQVTRHMPILPPYTSLMVAHAATGAHGRAVLGASYDHRVLSGFDVARLLLDLSKPQIPD